MKRIGRLALWGVAAGAAAIALLLAALWAEHFVPVTLPSPTGAYAVCRRVFDWREDAPETHGPRAQAQRELLVWVWYPAAPTPGTQVGDFLPAATVAELRRARGAFISQLLNHDLAKVRHHSFDQAPFASVGACPVILLRGGASSEIWNLSSLAEELASHGYVVVGIDAAAKTNVVVFPDGHTVRRDPSANPEGLGMSREHLDRLLASWVADMRFTVDRLATLNASEWCAHHLDLKRIGAVGHSFGGAQAAEFCAKDPRCRCGIDLDGLLLGDVVAQGVPTPFMFLLADHRQEDQAETARVLAAFDSIYQRLPSDRRAWLQIRGGNHFFFLDDSAVIKNHLAIQALRLVGVVRIDPSRQLEITRASVRSFLDAHLKNESAFNAADLVRRYPELTAR